MTYAQKLKNLRAKAGKTQAELAKILQTSQQYYGKSESLLLYKSSACTIESLSAGGAMLTKASVAAVTRASVQSAINSITSVLRMALGGFSYIAAAIG